MLEYLCVNIWIGASICVEYIGARIIQQVDPGNLMSILTKQGLAQLGLLNLKCLNKDIWKSNKLRDRMCYIDERETYTGREDTKEKKKKIERTQGRREQ